MMIEMKVKGLTLDPHTNVPIVVLRETEGDRALPIWVGIFEAHAIAREIESFETPMRVGVHGGIKRFYGVEPEEDLPATLDHIIAAVGG